jgi:hypothetical protein
MDDSSKRKSEAIAIAPEAFHGAAGDFVKLIAPHSEADEVALLVDLLTTFGNMVGPGPYFMAGRTKHAPRLYTVIVGNTARARKGTSRDEVAALTNDLGEELWLFDSVKTGLSSGEGLVGAMEVGPDFIPVEPRLFITEPEFARVLVVMKREGNTLSALVRTLWDSGTTGILVKKSIRIRGAHVSILAHITVEELLRHMTETEMASGFANRFNWHWVKRSQRLPLTSTPLKDDYEKIVTRLQANLSSAKLVAEMRRSREADEMWVEIYNAFDDDVGGMVGMLMARAEAQLLRLSMLYALTDGSHVIEVEHLVAAVAVWEHNARSINRIFGGRLGDSPGDRILAALDDAGEDGLTLTEIHVDVFQRNMRAPELHAVLRDLESKGLIESEKEPTAGRSKVRFRRTATKETKLTNKVPGLIGVDTLFDLSSFNSYAKTDINWAWIMEEAEKED